MVLAGGGGGGDSFLSIPSFRGAIKAVFCQGQSSCDPQFKTSLKSKLGAEV